MDKLHRNQRNVTDTERLHQNRLREPLNGRRQGKGQGNGLGIRKRDGSCRFTGLFKD